MGCDIHMNIEIKNKDGKWERYNWEDEYIVGKYDDGEPKYDWGEIFKNPLDINRNYDLFAILANVRNGYGFAGCDTGDGFVPISLPRGLPRDVSDEVKAKSDRWGVDGHSHTFLTLEELLKYNWKARSTKHRGWVSEGEYKTFKEEGKPESWSGGVSGNMVEHITNEEMDKRLKLKTKGKKTYVTQVEWEETYYDSVSYFVERFLKTASKLSTGKGTVRFVFWFDN